MARKSSTNRKKYHADVALQAADSFRRYAHSFLKSMPNDVNQAHHYAGTHFGDLIASATSLALALELYLKALRSTTGLSVPEKHHLWSLYKNLPYDIKRSIEEDYDRKNPTGGHDVAAIEVAIAPDKNASSASKEWDEKTSNPQLETNLKGVLLNASDAFQTWRYIYEVEPDKGFQVVRYEFMRLDLIAHVVRAHLVRLIGARKT